MEPLRTFWTVVILAAVLCGLSSCSGQKKEQEGAAQAALPAGGASISGTITLDPSLKDKVGEAPLLMIMASTSASPTRPALIVKREAGATFPHTYKLTADDITLVGSSFTGSMYVTARIDPAGAVGPPHPGMFEGTFPGNPVAVGSTRVDLVINKAY